jgi:hypothetical protein
MPMMMSRSRPLFFGAGAVAGGEDLAGASAAFVSFAAGGFSAGAEPMASVLIN